MRKPTFCICENKVADQLRGNREADQRLCFRYIDSSILLLSKSKLLAIFCSCTAWFVSDYVGNQSVGFLMTRLICQNHHPFNMPESLLSCTCIYPSLYKTIFHNGFVQKSRSSLQEIYEREYLSLGDLTG